MNIKRLLEIIEETMSKEMLVRAYIELIYTIGNFVESRYKEILNNSVKRSIKMNNVVELIKGRELTIDIAIFLSTQGIKCVINDGKVVDFVLE